MALDGVLTSYSLSSSPAKSFGTSARRSFSTVSGAGALCREYPTGIRLRASCSERLGVVAAPAHPA